MRLRLPRRVTEVTWFLDEAQLRVPAVIRGMVGSTGDGEQEEGKGGKHATTEHARQDYARQNGRRSKGRRRSDEGLAGSPTHEESPSEGTGHSFPVAGSTDGSAFSADESGPEVLTWQDDAVQWWLQHGGADVANVLNHLVESMNLRFQESNKRLGTLQVSAVQCWRTLLGHKI